MIAADIKHVLIGKLLDKAGHPNTFDTEALVAVRKAYDICSKANKQLSDAVVIESGAYYRMNTLSTKSLLSKIEHVTNELEEAREQTAAAVARANDLTAALATNKRSSSKTIKAALARITALEDEMSAVQRAKDEVDAELASARETLAKNSAPNKVMRTGRRKLTNGHRPEPGTRTRYKELRDAVIAFNPDIKLVWREYFLREAKNAVTHKDMYAWRDTGNVPDEAFALIKTFTKAPLVRDSGPLNGAHWSKQERNRLRELFEAGEHPKNIASTLTLEFGRHVSTQSIYAKMRQYGVKSA